MTNENIIAGNKLIAEFMEFEKGANSHYAVVLNGQAVTYLPPQHMQFNSSWNWLMPVISKCESIDSKRIREEIGFRNIFGANIEICWLACLAFIEWYNAQKTV